MRRCSFPATVVLLALLLPAGVRAGTPKLWGHLVPGSFRVGFRVMELTDRARPLEDGSPRPIQASVWYPAEGGGHGMRLRDYVDLVGTERLFDGDRKERARWAREEFREHPTLKGRVPEAIAERLLKAKTAARRDADPASGTFPVVLVAQGNLESPHRQAVACEYLASHGFVVVTMPSASRLTGTPRRLEDLLPKVEEQALDLVYLAAHLRELSPVPTGALGVVGFGLGGRAMLVYQLRSRAADALVSLDSGIGNHLGNNFLDERAYFRPQSFTAPLLHVYQPGDEVMTPDFELLERLNRSERYLVRLGGLGHLQFSNEAFLETLQKEDERLLTGRGHPQGAFEEALVLTEAFLASRLGARPGAFGEILAEAAAPAGSVEEILRLGPVGTAASTRVPVESYVVLETPEAEATIAAGAGEAWVRDPLRVALATIGAGSSEGFQVDRTDPEDKNPDETVVSLVADGLKDDSVRAEWTQVLLHRDAAGVWHPVETRRAWRCWRGHHRESYSKQLCL